MDAITHDEIWLICSTAGPAKNIKCMTQYLWPIKISSYISCGKVIEVQCPLQTFPKFVMEPNCTCLLLTLAVTTNHLVG